MIKAKEDSSALIGACVKAFMIFESIKGYFRHSFKLVEGQTKYSKVLHEDIGYD